MPSRKIPLMDWFYYHIFNRWWNKNTIFFEYKDYKRFVENMKYYNLEYPDIKLLAWSIMPNHFHFILKSDKSGLNISNYMRKVQQSYAMYFKTKYRALSPDLELLKIPQFFEWRFKAKLIEDEDYLNKVHQYVILNPIKHWIVDKIEDWAFTSYHQFEDKSGLDFNILDELDLE